MKNKWTFLLCVFTLTLALGACGSTSGVSNIDDSEETEFISEVVSDKIDEFTKGSYEIYSLESSSQECLGDLIYIEGSIERRSVYNNNLIGLVLKDDNGNEWLVALGNRPFFSTNIADTLIGKNVRAFGGYWGCLAQDNMPVININGNKMHIESLDDASFDMYLSDFSSTRDEYLDWFEENPNEILFEEYTNGDRVDTLAMSTGVVEKVAEYANTWIYFYQSAESGYREQYAVLKDIYLEEETPYALDFAPGDGIRFYYYIQPNGELLLLTYEKVDATFTLNDVENDYKNRCNTYTYEEIARNPESVKGERAVLVGEVVQVVEDGNSVTLRVDITKNTYGYYEDTIYVKYIRRSKTEDRILEDDIITIYGLLSGTETYTSTFGASITLPKIIAEYIEIK